MASIALMIGGAVLNAALLWDIHVLGQNHNFDVITERCLCFDCRE